MRAKITFKIRRQEGAMPYYHQHLLANWINALKSRDTQWQHYDQYTFSSLRGQASSLKAGLRYRHDQLRLVLSALNEAFVDFLVQAIFEQETWELGMIHLAPVQVDKQPLPELGTATSYLCLSPLVPSFAALQDEEAGRQFINPQRDLFSDWLYECTMNSMEQSELYTAADISTFFKFQLVPDHDYLQKLKRQGKLFARNYPVAYQGKQYEVRGYVFPFTLHAHPQVQAYVYTRGLGAFTQQGLGMLDVS
ncbi:MAG: CRISPR-associated endoribonuclease Cas6 [Bacteroidota bacterium]